MTRLLLKFGIQNFFGQPPFLNFGEEGYMANFVVDTFSLTYSFRTVNSVKPETQMQSTDRQRLPQPEAVKPKQQQSAACTPVKKAHHWIETLLKVPLTSSSVNKMTHSQLRRTSRNCLSSFFASNKVHKITV